MSTSRQTHLNQQVGKRSILKRNRERLYTDYASPSEDKATQRSIAEQAHAEWLTKQTRTINLSDHLRRKY
jgi:Fe-S cluster biosynthesis and repair protein YggX